MNTKEKKELEATIHRAFMRGMAIGSVITILLVYIILFIVATFPSVSAATSIQPTTPQPLIGCRDVDESGYYKLSSNLVFGSDDEDYCMDIIADNVIIDGQGHRIRCRDNHQGDCAYAIGVYGNDSYDGQGYNITIKNISIENISEGTAIEAQNINKLFLYNVRVENTTEGFDLYGWINNSIIQGNNFSKGSSEDTTEAISMAHTNNLTIKGNIIKDYDNSLAFYSWVRNDVLIYNNYFVAKADYIYFSVFYQSNTSNLRFNIPKTLGRNIIGGQYLAGNYWANYSGRGLSQTCSDNNGDGVCDYVCMNLGRGNYDFSPITNHGRGPVQMSCNIAVK